MRELMARLARISLTRPQATLAFLAVGTLLLAAGLPRVRTEFGFRVLLGGHHPSVRALEALIDRFGGGLPIQIAWVCGAGHPCANALDAHSLQMAAELTRALEALAALRSIVGVTTTPLLLPASDGFAVRRFVEAGAVVPDVDELAAAASQDPLWVGNLVSADGTVGSIVVQPVDTRSETDLAVVDGIQDALAPFRARGFEFHLVGNPVSAVVSGRDLADSMTRLIPFTILFIALVLVVFLGSLRAAFAGLATMGLAMVWTFGLLGWLAWPRDAILEMLAPLILVVGICDAIHLLSRYGEEAAQLPSEHAAAERVACMLEAARGVGPPCLFTNLTTAAGFASFATSELDTFVRFGLTAAFGIVSCLVLTFSALPLLCVRLSPRGSRPRELSATWRNVLAAIVRTAERRASLILTATVGVLALAVLGWATRLEVDTYWYELIGENSASVRSIRFLEDRLRPSASLELEIALPRDGPVESPDVLGRVRDLSGFLEGIDGLGDATSAVDFIARANRLVHDDDASFAREADSAQANAELLELIGFDDPAALSNWVTLDRSTLRISVAAHEMSNSNRKRILATVREELAASIPDGWRVALSGPLVVNHDWVRDIAATQLRSFPTAFAVVFLQVAFFLQSFRLALAAMVPAVLPALVTLGTMGWMGVSLDVGRAMIGTVLVGISVDDSIHLLSAYRAQREQGRGPRVALSAALLAVGRPIVTTSAALSLGFLTFVGSAWQTISSFGFFVSLAILGALAVTLFVLPALILVFSRER